MYMLLLLFVRTLFALSALFFFFTGTFVLVK